MHFFRFLQPVMSVVPLMWAASILPASAVIVAGTLGTGNNNASQAGLDAYLGTTSYAPFGYWGNLVRSEKASGVYLGYNASTMRGWVLAANHVATPTTITVGGSVYTVTGSGTQVGSSDLKLYEIGGGVSDPALPSLPSVPLAGIAATAGEFTLMTGRGFTSDVTPLDGYDWDYPGTNDANGMRWASNTVEGTAVVNIGSIATPNNQPYLYVDFDGVGDPGVTAYDGQGATGDSGGGIFIYRGGQWVLSGAAHFVDDGPAFLEDPETGDDLVDPSQPGDFTAYSDISSHVDTINGITGTLVPESSVISFAGLAALMLCRRRRH